MIKAFENIFKTRTDIKFLPNYKLKKIVKDPRYQIVEFMTIGQWKNNHSLFSIRILPTNFIQEYPFYLNKKSKIVLLGNWRKLVYFYRILKFNGYKVYLCRKENYNEKK